MVKVQRWQDVWNKRRKLWGIAIEGSTPLDKLKEVHSGLINMNVVNFPVITLEELTSMVHSDFFWLTSFEPLSLLLHGGKYLRGRCPI